jgi:hypothetical protein
MLRRYRQHVGAGLRSDPEGLGCGEVMVKGIENIDASQLVAIPIENSLNRQPTHLQTEPCVLLE